MNLCGGTYEVHRRTSGVLSHSALFLWDRVSYLTWSWFWSPHASAILLFLPFTAPGLQGPPHPCQTLKNLPKCWVLNSCPMALNLLSWPFRTQSSVLSSIANPANHLMLYMGSLKYRAAKTCPREMKEGETHTWYWMLKFVEQRQETQLVLPVGTWGVQVTG